MLKRYCLSVFLFTLIGLAISPASFAQEQSSESVIPEGTEIQLALLDPISSKLSEPGDEIRAVVRRDVFVDGIKMGRTNRTIEIGPGTYTVTLGSPRDYTPTRRRPSITDTFADAPLLVEFEMVGGDGGDG